MQSIESSVALTAFQTKVTDLLAPAVATPYSAFEQFGAAAQPPVAALAPPSTFGQFAPPLLAASGILPVAYGAGSGSGQ